MKLTKYEHACLVIEDENKKLVIDPGSFTTLQTDLTHITAVVVTEEHMDHFNTDNLKKILEQSPEAVIYTTNAVNKQLEAAGIASTAIQGKQSQTAGPFTLSFEETDHAVVYGTSPCRSLPVTVNNYLYYPSDTYHVISDHVHVLALPTSGPWYKLSESIDFAKQIKSDVIIATHNALNSDAGNMVTHSFKNQHLNKELVLLQPGESLND